MKSVFAEKVVWFSIRLSSVSPVFSDVRGYQLLGGEARAISHLVSILHVTFSLPRQHHRQNVCRRVGVCLKPQ